MPQRSLKGKTIMLFATIAMMLFSGCTTFFWNMYMEDKTPLYETSPRSSEDTDYHVLQLLQLQDSEPSYVTFIRYRQGLFMGTKLIDNVQHYHYVIADILSERFESSIQKKYLNIFIPVGNANRVARVERTGKIADQGEPVFVRYTVANKASKGVLIMIKQAESSKFHSSGYPMLLDMAIPSYGAPISMSLGKKIDSPSELLSKDVLISSVICRPNAKDPIYELIPYTSIPDKANVDGCNWYWTDTYNSNSRYRPFSYWSMKTIQYLGYLVTAPVDIATSPFQLILYMMIKDAPMAGGIP